MMRRALLSLTAAAIPFLGPAEARAQSERSIERWAESIAAAAERLAVKVERKATTLAERIEAEVNDRSTHGRRSRSDRDDDRTHRDLPFQAPRIDTSFAFSSAGVVDLSSAFGDIVVTGSDTREARVKAWTDRGRLEYEFSSSRLTIEHRNDRGSSRGRSSDSRYEVSIPRGARVILRSTSGDIVVHNTRGEVEVNSTSGDVIIEDAVRVEAGTLSGDITVRTVKGNVEASTVNGTIEASGVDGDIKLGSTSGDLIVSDSRGRDVELSTTTGEVAYAGAIDPNGRYEFHSHSGTIDLAIPAGTNARFSVETFSGEIDSDFPITLQPGDRTSSKPRRFEFTVGTGGPRIIAESFSGGVEIRKR